MRQKTVLIVDALNLFTRHFVANPSMVSIGRRSGEPCGGAVGFLNNISWLLNIQHPTDLVVVWESGGSSRRRKIFPEYKTHRRPQKLNRYYEDDIPTTVENRNWQIATIVSALNHLGTCQVYVKDCEADDVIGFLSRYKFKDADKIILSSDKDFYQLLDDDVTIYSPTAKKFIRSEDVIEKFGISPNNFCTAKALCGDPSDNIPGIKGVGFKTLAKRFPALSGSTDVSVNDIIAESKRLAKEKKRPPKVFGKIIDGEDVAKRNWKLMYLDTIGLSGSQIKKIHHAIDTFEPQFDKMSLLRFLNREGLTSINVDSLFRICRENLK